MSTVEATLTEPAIIDSYLVMDNLRFELSVAKGIKASASVGVVPADRAPDLGLNLNADKKKAIFPTGYLMQVEVSGSITLPDEREDGSDPAWLLQLTLEAEATVAFQWREIITAFSLGYISDLIGNFTDNTAASTLQLGVQVVGVIGYSETPGGDGNLLPVAPTAQLQFKFTGLGEFANPLIPYMRVELDALNIIPQADGMSVGYSGTFTLLSPNDTSTVILEQQFGGTLGGKLPFVTGYAKDFVSLGGLIVDSCTTDEEPETTNDLAAQLAELLGGAAQAFAALGAQSGSPDIRAQLAQLVATTDQDAIDLVNRSSIADDAKAFCASLVNGLVGTNGATLLSIAGGGNEASQNSIVPGVDMDGILIAKDNENDKFVANVKLTFGSPFNQEIDGYIELNDRGVVAILGLRRGATVGEVDLEVGGINFGGIALAYTSYPFDVDLGPDFPRLNQLWGIGIAGRLSLSGSSLSEVGKVVFGDTPAIDLVGRIEGNKLTVGNAAAKTIILELRGDANTTISGNLSDPASNVWTWAGPYLRLTWTGSLTVQIGGAIRWSYAIDPEEYGCESETDCSNIFTPTARARPAVEIQAGGGYALALKSWFITGRVQSWNDFLGVEGLDIQDALLSIGNGAQTPAARVQSEINQIRQTESSLKTWMKGCLMVPCADDPAKAQGFYEALQKYTAELRTQRKAMCSAFELQLPADPKLLSAEEVSEYEAEVTKLCKGEQSIIQSLDDRAKEFDNAISGVVGNRDLGLNDLDQLLGEQEQLERTKQTLQTELNAAEVELQNERNSINSDPDEIAGLEEQIQELKAQIVQASDQLEAKTEEVKRKIAVVDGELAKIDYGSLRPVLEDFQTRFEARTAEEEDAFKALEPLLAKLGADSKKTRSVMIGFYARATMPDSWVKALNADYNAPGSVAFSVTLGSGPANACVAISFGEPGTSLDQPAFVKLGPGDLIKGYYFQFVYAPAECTIGEYSYQSNSFAVQASIWEIRVNLSVRWTSPKPQNGFTRELAIDILIPSFKVANLVTFSDTTFHYLDISSGSTKGGLSFYFGKELEISGGVQWGDAFLEGKYVSKTDAGTVEGQANADFSAEYSIYVRGADINLAVIEFHDLLYSTSSSVRASFQPAKGTGVGFEWNLYADITVGWEGKGVRVKFGGGYSVKVMALKPIPIPLYVWGTAGLRWNFGMGEEQSGGGEISFGLDLVRSGNNYFYIGGKQIVPLPLREDVDFRTKAVACPQRPSDTEYEFACPQAPGVPEANVGGYVKSVAPADAEQRFAEKWTGENPFANTDSAVGVGGGTGGMADPGIDCGTNAIGTCSTTVPYGTTILLEAVANPGSVFLGWQRNPNVVPSLLDPGVCGKDAVSATSTQTSGECWLRLNGRNPPVAAMFGPAQVANTSASVDTVAYANNEIAEAQVVSTSALLSAFEQSSLMDAPQENRESLTGIRPQQPGTSPEESTAVDDAAEVIALQPPSITNPAKDDPGFDFMVGGFGLNIYANVTSSYAVLHAELNTVLVRTTIDGRIFWGSNEELKAQDQKVVTPNGEVQAETGDFSLFGQATLQIIGTEFAPLTATILLGRGEYDGSHPVYLYVFGALNVLGLRVEVSGLVESTGKFEFTGRLYEFTLLGFTVKDSYFTVANKGNGNAYIAFAGGLAVGSIFDASISGKFGVEDGSPGFRIDGSTQLSLGSGFNAGGTLHLSTFARDAGLKAVFGLQVGDFLGADVAVTITPNGKFYAAARGFADFKLFRTEVGLLFTNCEDVDCAIPRNDTVLSINSVTSFGGVTFGFNGDVSSSGYFRVETYANGNWNFDVKFGPLKIGAGLSWQVDIILTSDMPYFSASFGGYAYVYAELNLWFWHPRLQFGVGICGGINPWQIGVRFSVFGRGVTLGNC